MLKYIFKTVDGKGFNLFRTESGKGRMHMNPVLIFLIIVAAVVLWLLLSFLYEPVGKLFYRILKNTKDDAMDDKED